MTCRLWAKIKAPEEITYTKASMITIGDYISSALEHQDLHTAGLDLSTRKDFDRPWRVDPRTEFIPPRRFTFIDVLSRRKWVVTYVLMCLLVLPFYALLGVILYEHRKIGMPIDLPSLWAEGIGVFQNYAYFPSFSSEDSGGTNGPFHARRFHMAALFANIPQLFISGGYVILNNLLTTISITDEWNTFIHRRQPLRVSQPKGSQRSSYFLSLPFHYAIGLITWSGVTHWLVSRSLFVVESNEFASPDFVHFDNQDSAVVGHSAMGIILTTIAVSLTLFVPIVISFRNFEAPKSKENNDWIGREAARYPMPLTSTCSAGISAACHRHEQDLDAHLLPITWGFVEDDPESQQEELRGRFCFTTARDVQWPERYVRQNAPSFQETPAGV
ncbi:hypothetical protein PFICI_00213 [Pestalotiopsis fici W106-1]|uniref:Uncharacterized protein n=1 Tax=Pestalotiopsis fici (strain W106-1 / CGMCC3.15140) TaxID=1229662 RepID=W3XK59_PESFW|nr:uncharacterized protein PFICI_00213 [Pestalotiopsis fici W106-1]ETS86385.1 hypothetical protein PFICI_00213 [Pestalotiopsis fici W106-1]